MSDFIAHIGNCLIWSDEFSKSGNGKIRNVISLKLNNKNITIIQNPDLFSLKNRIQYERKFIASTKIIIKDVKTNELKKVKRLVTRLSFLLALATQSQVHFYAYEYPRYSKSWGRGNTVTLLRNPLIEEHGDKIKIFIEQVWKNFNREFRRRNLSTIINYMIDSNRTDFTIELKLLINFVTLEALKESYARIKKIPYNRGRFRKNNGRPYSFEELLSKMFKELKIKRGIKKINKMRNEIIHSGISKKNFNSKWKMFQYSKDLIRTCVIKMMGYNGHYYKF